MTSPPRLAWLLVLSPIFAVQITACSGDDSSGGGTQPGAGGSTASGGSSSAGTSSGGSPNAGNSASGGSSPGGASGGASPQCSGITGTYDMTRARSKTNPGSCPPTLQVNPKIPGKVAADNNEPSGYRVEVGYSNLDTPNEFDFKPCTNNVAGCSIFATCSPTGATDQIKLTISGNSISGTIERYDNDDNCSVNFLLSGTRK